MAADSSGYLSSFIDAAHRASGSARALIVIAAVLVALAVVLAARRRLVPTREVAKVSEGTLLVVPALLSLVVVVVIAPLHSDRYEYHLISLLTLAVGWLFAWVKVSLGSRAEAGAGSGAVWEVASRRSPALAAVFLAVAVAFSAGIVLFDKAPSYLYPQDVAKNAFAREHDSDPCLYFTANVNPSLSADLVQLLNYESILVVDDVSDKDLVGSYLQEYPEADRLVVYLGTYKHDFDEDVVLAQVKDLYGYASCERVFKEEHARVYLFTK